MDVMTEEQRRRCMQAVKSKDTKPEMLVRKYLFNRGFRYRLNYPGLPGHPDIVLAKFKTVIFVNGCFWHQHDGCKMARIPKTNVGFWKKKFERNKLRDSLERRQLAAMGWHYITIWECQLSPKNRQRTLESLENTLSRIFLDRYRIDSYPIEDGETEIAAEPSLAYGALNSP